MSDAPAKMPARLAAREVAGRLSRAGFRALFAGGCVRDHLMGREPADFDIATDATPEQIKTVFTKARGVGEAFGVMLVRHAGHTFEVATFRKDGPYQDGRRPTSVTFSGEVEDAQRRDFTVNGIFEEPESGKPVDHVDGTADIKAKVIRAIGDPHARIAEDRLRMLRAVRFAARLGFAIDPATAAAIQTHAGELRAVSPERVGEELRKMLAHPARATAARLAEELALDGAVFGARGTAGAAPRLSALAPAADWVTALAAWMLDRAQVARGGLPRPAPRESVAAVAELRSRLTLSNHETDALHSLLAARDAVLGGRGGVEDAHDFESLPLAARVRWMARPGFDAALAVVAAEAPDLAARVRADADRELPGRRLPAPLLDGNALLAAGFRAGPRFKVLLDLALDAQIEGRVRTTAEALELARAAEAPAP